MKPLSFQALEFIFEILKGQKIRKEVSEIAIPKGPIPGREVNVDDPDVDKPIGDLFLGLLRRTVLALKNQGLETSREVMTYDRAQLSRIPDLGRVGLEAVEGSLATRRWHLWTSGRWAVDVTPRAPKKIPPPDQE